VPPSVRGLKDSLPGSLPPLLAGLLLCLPAYAAESPEQQLKSVEKRLDESRSKEADYARQAESLAAELARLREDSIAAAKAAQEHEAALSALEERLAALGAQEAEKAQELKQHRTQQVELLMALERIARNPPEGLALASGDPLDAARSALLLGAAVPPLEARARNLRQEIATLAELRRQIAEAQERHRGERLVLDDEQARLRDLVTRKQELQRIALAGVEESGQREAQLAAQAADLQQLIDRLSAERRARDAEAQKRQEEAQRQALLAQPRPDAPNADTAEVVAPPPVRLDPGQPKLIRPFAAAHGLMVYPATGRLVLRFGENDELGVASKGLTFETRPKAEVIAPFDGRVVFAGPFRGYGHILIIEHRDGYHSLLAGLDKVDGSVGQWLIAGEPVGVMPGGEKKPHLYLELRHDGQPINPSPWLATRDEKVSG
jgi:murein hydrolase activator